jgi:HEAT repeat protein
MKLEEYIRDLASGNDETKVQACEDLAESTSLEAVPALIVASRDKCRKVQVAAVLALGSLRAHGAVPSLAALLGESSDPILRAAVAYALGEIGDKASATSLLAALHRAEHKDRGFIVRALGKVGDVRATDALQAFLSSSKWEDKLDAALALAELGDGRGRNALEELVDDPALPEQERSKLHRRLSMLRREPSRRVDEQA